MCWFLQSVPAQSFRKTEYSLQEIKKWCKDNRDFSTWKGKLLYQGSDSLQHYFIGRFADEFTWFRVPRRELTLKDEIPYNKTPGAPLGYYYVDPLEDFAITGRYNPER